MCGLVGILKQTGTKIKGIENVFNDLLYTHGMRGFDSAGVNLVFRNAKGEDKYLLYKKAMMPNDFIFSTQYRKFVYPRIEDASLVMGHTRSATANKNNLIDENAHPFQVDHIILAHNGHIQNAQALLPNEMLRNIDSVAAAYCIAQYGEVEGLEKLRGPFALTWYNGKDQTFNIARNDGRELVVAFVKDANAIVYASELYLLHACLERNDWHPEGKYRVVLPYGIYKHDMNDPKGGMKRIPFHEPRPLVSDRRAAHMGQGTHDTSTGDKECLGSTLSGKDQTKTTASDRSWLQPTNLQLEDLRSRVKSLGRYVQFSNFPTSTKKLQALSARVSAKGHRLGRSYFVIPISFQLYKNQRELGEIVGTLRGDTSGNMAVIAGVKNQDFKDAAAKGWSTGVMVNMKHRMGNVHYILLPEALMNKTKKEIVCCETVPECCNNGYCKAMGPQDTLVPGPRGSTITINKFLSLTQRGCSLCTRDISVAQAKECVWRGDDVICLDCATDPVVSEENHINLKEMH